MLTRSPTSSRAGPRRSSSRGRSTGSPAGSCSPARGSTSPRSSWTCSTSSAASIRIVELDTGLLFPETYETRDRLIEKYDLDVERIDPRQTVAEQEETEGPELWKPRPRPLLRAAQGRAARARAGRDGRLDHRHPPRAERHPRQRPRARARPARRGQGAAPRRLETTRTCKGYLFAHDVPYNPLHDRGFPSIGCTHCTRAIRPGEDSRAGRWADAEKTECGLHLPAQDAPPTLRNRSGPSAPEEGGTSERAIAPASPCGSPGCRAPASRPSPRLVGPELERRGALVEYLDGDVVRTHLSKGLGFSKEDRDTNIGRIGWVASRFTRAGAATLVSAISPYADTRAAARAMVEEFGAFVEVFVDTSVEECADARREGPLRQGVLGRDQGVHRGQRPVRGAGEPRGPHRHRVRRRRRRARPRSSPRSRRAASSAARSPRSGPRRADLHSHTVASDGSLAPAALVALAAECGVAVLAVTDHDTLAGVPEALAAGRGPRRARRARRRAVGEARPRARCTCWATSARRRPQPLGGPAGGAAGRPRGARPAHRGAPRGDRRADRRSPTSPARAAGAIGRPHVADALVAAGHARDRQDAFDRYLGDGGPA